jgi:hypothetical protein
MTKQKGLGRQNFIKNFLQGVVKLYKVSYSIISELGFSASSFWVMKGGEKGFLVGPEGEVLEAAGCTCKRERRGNRDTLRFSLAGQKA